MDEDDECMALRQVLQQRCPGSKFTNGDIKKLVDAGYDTESALAAASKESLDIILPTRPGVVHVLVKAFVQPAGNAVEHEDVTRWQQRLKSLVEDGGMKERIVLKLAEKTPEFRSHLFRDTDDDVLREALLALIEPAAATGSLSWEKWLRQQLPPLTFGTCSSVPGLRPSKDEHILAPASTVEWPDFWTEVDRYLELAAADKHSLHERIDIKVSVKCRRLTSEADCVSVYDSLLTKIGDTLFGDKFTLELQKSSLSSSRMQHSTTNRPGALNNPSADVKNAMRIATRNIFLDILLKYENRGIVVVEMKKPSFFRTGIENSIPDLVKAYGERGNLFSDVRRYPVLAQSVEQLFMDLYDCCIGYGIISSADLSYFVRRVGDTLHISQGVEWQNPKFVAALSYFLQKAESDAPADTSGGVWKPAADFEGLIDDSEDSAVSDQDLFIAPKNLTITGTNRRSTRTLGAGSDLKETPVERLHLDSHPFARGWSGSIVRGTYKGVPVAVKLALVGTDRAEALVNEASAYLRLQNCWRTYTPALVSHGTTADGHLVYIATELIEGLELGMGNLTPEVVEASFEALNAIHGFGLLHGDVRPANILVPRTGWQGVRFIDFGFSRSIATDVDCRKELQELQGIVRQWYPCTRASPPPGQVAQPENRMILPSQVLAG